MVLKSFLNSEGLLFVYPVEWSIFESARGIFFAVVSSGPAALVVCSFFSFIPCGTARPMGGFFVVVTRVVFSFVVAASPAVSMIGKLCGPSGTPRTLTLIIPRRKDFLLCVSWPIPRWRLSTMIGFIDDPTSYENARCDRS